uniref:Uncharacterized protein n=1 Tax=Trieres chinensis TaxID=1514140 RepID=A0A7S1YWK3_TRICV|mmetsp:Transcript_12395/g.25729  ORF Transcript_12395/g.25729 Transcript_12395/m.25729 type:complete len:116 (+) Transcript_12395:139-486(+)
MRVPFAFKIFFLVILLAPNTLCVQDEWADDTEDLLRKRVHHAQVSLWKYRQKLRDHFDGEVKLSDDEVQRVGRKIIKFKKQLRELLADGRLGYWKLEQRDAQENPSKQEDQKSQR